MSTSTCVECKREMRPQRSKPDGRPRHTCRGLCNTCYVRVVRQGRLEDYPRVQWRNGDLIEDARWVGLDERLPLNPQFRAIAERLGCTPDALSRAYYRACEREREAA